MKSCFNNARISPIWAAALLLSAATLIAAFRAPVDAWRAQQQLQQQPYHHERWENDTVSGAELAHESERSSNKSHFASALQVASAGEKHGEEEEHSEGSATETAASHGEKGKHTEMEDSRTAEEATEQEEPEESAHLEEAGSKTEEASAKESNTAEAGHAALHAAEAETAKGTPSEEEKEEVPHPSAAGSVKEPPAEGAAEAAPSGKVSAAAVPKPEHKEEAAAAAGGAPAAAAAVPPTDKFVMQLNFRPSLVIGRAEADKTERHVITDKAVPWFEIIGPKTLTVLNLKPVKGEELLHSVAATTKHP